MIGRVVWITGLSGAGKTTLASALVESLSTVERAVVLLDGDELRKIFAVNTSNSENYSRDGRITLALQYSRLCMLLAKQGFTVVIATISLFKEIHSWNRANLPNYFEVYLKVPVEELRRRDPKGIYRRFFAGQLTDVAGLDVPIDEPEAADWVVEFESGRPATVLAEDCLRKLCKSPPDLC